MTDLIQDFSDDLELRGIGKGTKKTYITILRHYERFLNENGKSLEGISKPDLRSFLQYLRSERGQRASTLQLHFSVLAGFYDFLLEEELISSNPVLHFRKRHLANYRKSKEASPRKLITIDQAATLCRSIIDSRDKAIITLLFKTGARRHELADLDLSDIDMAGMAIRLKETPKRTNRLIFLDVEAMTVLDFWLRTRERMISLDNALFIGPGGYRLKPDSISRIVTEHATRIGLHDPKSDKPEDHFTAHCCRHWFTTHLRRAGMPREFIQELRGDVRRETMDIYYHIDQEELRRSYLAHIPQFEL